MSWLTPWGLLGLVSVPVVVALSLWRWRRREVSVSSLLLWRQVAAAWHDAPKARRRRRLDPLVALRVAVALVLTAALCGLVWVHVGSSSRRVVLVIDRSASMAAKRPDGGSRWEACRADLLALLRRVGTSGRVEVVGVPGDSVGGLTPDAAAEALGWLVPQDAPLARRELVAVATRAARLAPGALVVVATDDAELPGLPAGVHVVAGGGAADNRGIVALAARQRHDGTHEVLVAVANAATRAATAEVVLLGDGKELGRQRLAVAARGRGQAVFKAALGSVAVLDARVEADDALAADNRAWLARRTRPLRVAWVGENSYALRRALAVQAGVAVVEAVGDSVPPDADLVVCYRAAPPAIGKAPIVAVAPRTAVGGLRVTGEVEAGAVSVTARHDPLMTAVALDGVRVGPVPRIGPPEGFETLARAGTVPLVGRWREGDTTVVYVGIDPARSNWSLTPSFPIFWANVVASVAGGAGSGMFVSAHPGDLCRVGAAGARVRGPEGQDFETETGVFRPQRVGLYRAQSKGGGAHSVAVSLLSEEETMAVGSQVGLLPGVLAGTADGVRAASALRLSGWLAALGLVLVAVHGWAMRGGRRI